MFGVFGEVCKRDLLPLKSSGFESKQKSKKFHLYNWTIVIILLEFLKQTVVKNKQ